ncbi:SGNH/GDSL hydrolase family protein [Mangrovivirga sp. M17]|uniref:SGNH/GDSL hydrolase family protein n=1 Tax=Mangrovivirga halotolerans TaxID=2993936 RepID=A0ABT3RKE7_9BACT|nr:SGNH/GDSL hydrolase family protein [Mangrovivirga halotolerans]MCX2742313.1 SGNH/GDSL hydrolase family protein [Mangrovivirga halotolerans]
MKLNPNIKYIIGSVLSLPLFPFLIFDGYKIKRTIPQLPEAKDLNGFIDRNFEKTINLIAIGESTIAGVGSRSNAQGFTGILAKELAEIYQSNVNWKVFAKSGYTVRDVNRELIPKIKEEKVDIIVVGLGANDAFEFNSPFRWRNQLRLLIKNLRIKYPTTPIYFNNMPPIKEFPAFTTSLKFTFGNLVEILGDVLNDTVKEFDNVFYNKEEIKISEWERKYRNYLETDIQFFSDGVHPTEFTYKILAIDMANFIVNKTTKIS